MGANAQLEGFVEDPSSEEIFELDGLTFIQESFQAQLVIVQELEGKNVDQCLRS